MESPDKVPDQRNAVALEATRGGTDAQNGKDNVVGCGDRAIEGLKKNRIAGDTRGKCQKPRTVLPDHSNIHLSPTSRSLIPSPCLYLFKLG